MSRWNYEDVNRIFGLATLTGAVCELRFFFVCSLPMCLRIDKQQKKETSFGKESDFAAFTEDFSLSSSFSGDW